MAKSRYTLTAALADMPRVARSLAAIVEPGVCVALHGDMGAGKTTLAREIAGALGYDGGASPTFAILLEYPAAFPIYHMDLYRLSGPEEVADEDLDRLFAANGLCLIEWPERAAGLLPTDAWVLTIEGIGDLRKLTLEGPVCPLGWEAVA